MSELLRHVDRDQTIVFGAGALERGGATGLGVDDDVLCPMVDAALRRPELARVAPPLGREDVEHIPRSAS